MSEDIRPPRLADSFLRKFCRSELLEEVIGDLHEMHLTEFQELPRWKSNMLYWYHILHFMRPFALKRKRQNSNFIMYQSYFKFAWRNILKHRGSASLNVLSLSVGVTCFIFIFIYLRGELSYDRFHQDSDRMYRVAIDFVDAQGNRLPDATTPPALAFALKRDFPQVEASTHIFPSWGAKFLFGTEEKKIFEDTWVRADSTFFDVFSFSFIHGDPSEALSTKEKMVISQSAAIKYFGREDVIGESLTIFGDERNTTFQISGVIEDVPYNSHFKFDFLSKISFQNLYDNWGWYNFYTYMKLKPNADIASMEPELQPFFEGYLDESEYYNIIYTQPIADIHLKSHLKWELEANGDINNVYIFTGLAVFILLISCLNYLNLTIAESVKRFKEVGVRKVFGAYRTSLVAQFIVETLMITFISLVIGSLVAELLFRNMSGLLGREITLLVPQNLLLLGVIALVVFIIASLAGLYPALHLSSFKVASVIKGVISRSGRTAVSLRSALLVVQFSISAFMIFGALGVYQQLKHMREIDKGLDPSQVLIVENFGAVSNQNAMKDELLKIPGIESVGRSNGILGKLNWTRRIGYPDEFLLNYVVMDFDYIETNGLEIIAGRDFDPSIATDKQGYNCILNEKALTELGYTLDDVGKSLPMYLRDDTIRNGTIIGVVKDFQFTDLKLDIKPFAFYNREGDVDFLHLKVSPQNVQETLSKIEDTWSVFADNKPIDYFFMDSVYEDLVAQEDRLSKIVLWLTILAFFIAFIGMFAIANISIKDRKKEIAIRKVLGASVTRVSNLITSRFLILVLIANAIAVPVAYFAMQAWLDGFVDRISIGFYLFIIAIGSTVAVAWTIVGYQSFKTAIGNPVNSLRAE